MSCQGKILLLVLLSVSLAAGCFLRTAFSYPFPTSLPRSPSFWNNTCSAIGFQDLTPELQKEVQELQKRMAVELQPLVLEQSLTMQKILEAQDHKARCRLLKYFMDAETKRLESKKSLKGLFSSSSSTLAPGAAIPPEEMITDSSSLSSPEPRSSSTFFDEEDAFQ